ncbi:MAG TPA: VOC family protein [Candidatus Obscuribacterales bacterium]
MSAIILWTNRLKPTVEFYRALGLPLDEEQHEEGPLHYACHFGGTHFAVFEGEGAYAIPRRESGATQIGLYLDDVDEAFSIAIKLGAQVVWQPRDMPWGRAALVCDPDGRAVELNQGNADSPAK